MKKLLIALLLPVAIMGQDGPKPFVSINAGLAMPFGYFGTGQASPENASRGTNYNLTFALPLFKSKFGVIVNGGYSVNSYDQATYTKLHNEYLNWIPSYQEHYACYFEGTIDYTNKSLMAGAYFTIPIKKLSFDLRAMAGMISGSVPNIELYYSYLNCGSGNTLKYPNPIKMFGYDAGLSIKYSITKNLLVAVTADMMAAHKAYTLELYDNTGRMANHYDGNHYVQLINVTAGIGYSFGK